MLPPSRLTAARRVYLAQRGDTVRRCAAIRTATSLSDSHPRRLTPPSCSSRGRTLVESFVFPQLSFNAEKQNLWEGDPVGYLRDARVGRDELPVLPREQLHQDDVHADFGFHYLMGVALRFGALNMTTALGPWIMRHPDVSGNTEQFLLQFCDARVFEHGGVYAGYCAFPSFRFSVACEVLDTVTKEGFQWSSDEHLNVNFCAVAAALDDPEFPIISTIDSAPEILVHVQEAIILKLHAQERDSLYVSVTTATFRADESLTFKLRAISPNLWPVFELTYNLCKSDAADSLEGMLPSLDSFVSYGSDDVKTRPDCQRMLLGIHQTSITSSSASTTASTGGGLRTAFSSTCVAASLLALSADDRSA
ncbi:hypothetical protein B0H14DRAFT_3866299 [Mycena olivaceomarginata]|nr:hypothetical protein B0H14DRAFT_3866299 [Mycena olivaceomarginata]